MRVYVVVTVMAGVIDEVKGFSDPSQADTYLAKKRRELDIRPGYEEESENDAQLHTIDVETYPTSVAVRRQTI